MRAKKRLAAAVVVAILQIGGTVEAFQHHFRTSCRQSDETAHVPAFVTALHSTETELDPEHYTREDGTIDWDQALKDAKIPVELQERSASELREELVATLSIMTGTAAEYKSVEGYINALEDKYVSPTRLMELNDAVGGEWRLLFSTNLLGRASPKLRLREMRQEITPSISNGFEGEVVNVAQWDLSKDGDGIFTYSGSFSVKCAYAIHRGTKMDIERKDVVLKLGQGSAVPSDPEGLVGLLGQAMPSELFDPDGLGMVTTYCNEGMRIGRMAGRQFEGVRNVFVRNFV